MCSAAEYIGRAVRATAVGRTTRTSGTTRSTAFQTAPAAIANPFGYAGQYTDSETGFEYLRARYYDPATGQFLHRDPLAPITGTPYAYAGNDPTNMVDPSGLYPGQGFVNKIVPDCPFGKNPNGSCRGSGAAEKAVDVSVGVANAPVTAATAAANSWTGGDCDWGPHLTVICYGGAVSQANPFADTWTTGSTINTTYSKERFAEENCGGLLGHETVHTKQWAAFGPVAFPALYLGKSVGSLAASGDPAKYNFFEWQAGFEGGGYTDCTC